MTFKSCLLLTAALVGAVPAAAQQATFDISGVTVAPELAARVPAHIRQRGALVVGSDNAYAPWEYLAGADGQTPMGIDVDLGMAIARVLDLTFESRTAPFATILPSLGANYDIGLSAFSITAERMKAVNFVAYAATTSLWAVRAGNPTAFDPADYCGRTVAVQSGSRHEEHVAADNDDCVAAGKPAVTVLPFATAPEALTRVAAGGADATVSGGATIGHAAAQSQGRLQAIRAAGRLGVQGLNGIAFAKDDVALAELVADALNHLIDTGVYRGIWDHWGIGEMAVPEAVVNPAITW